MNKRAHLKAIVSIWIVNRDPVDGANEGREIVDGSWEEAYELTGELVTEGLLHWANEDEAQTAANAGSTYSMVIPTALGIFEAFS